LRPNLTPTQIRGAHSSGILATESVNMTVSCFLHLLEEHEDRIEAVAKRKIVVLFLFFGVIIKQIRHSLK